MLAPIFLIIIAFITLQTINVAIADTAKFISDMIVLSFKKIPNISVPLAPSALKTPISRFLLEILVEMKFIRRRDANIANAIAI